MDLIDDTNHARHALAAQDTKLTFVERSDVPLHRNNALLGGNFQLSQKGHVLTAKEIYDSSFQVKIRMQIICARNRHEQNS